MLSDHYVTNVIRTDRVESMHADARTARVRASASRRPTLRWSGAVARIRRSRLPAVWVQPRTTTLRRTWGIHPRGT